MKEVIKCVMGLIVLVAIMFMVIMFFSSASATKAYNELPLGSTYKELIYIAGKPTYETNGKKWVERQFDKAPDQLVKGCVREAWYEYWLPFVPSKYSFCFDAGGLLLHKYHWASW